MTLNASAAKGASSDVSRWTSASVFGSIPWMGGTSSGLGR